MRCDEVIDTGRARSENHGALRARDWVGGSAPLPARISAWSERGWRRGARAKTATLVHRRVEDPMQVTPVRRPVRPGLACQAVEETSTSKVLRLGRFDADRSSSMRFACFQLCGRVIRYFCLGDAQSILVPEGVAGAALVC